MKTSADTQLCMRIKTSIRYCMTNVMVILERGLFVWLVVIYGPECQCFFFLVVCYFLGFKDRKIIEI